MGIDKFMSMLVLYDLVFITSSIQLRCLSLPD